MLVLITFISLENKALIKISPWKKIVIKTTTAGQSHFKNNTLWLIMAALLTFSLQIYRYSVPAIKCAHWWSVTSPGLTTSSVYTVPKKRYLLLSETTNQHNSCTLDEVLILALEREQHIPPGEFDTRPDYLRRLKIYSHYVFMNKK